MLTRLLKGEKKFKKFSDGRLEDFFDLPLSTTPVVYLKLQISLQIFDKI
jgi:hypothetical protein